MDLKVMFSSFVLIFLSELGDKTQLATLAFASSSHSKLSVFIGASTALVVATLLAVLFAEVLGRYMPVKQMHLLAGVLFIVIGGFMVFKELYRS